MDGVRVLCLHGCHMTAETMKSCLKGWTTTGSGKAAEWHFLAAPFCHPEGGRTWTDPPLRVEDLAADGKCALPVNYDSLAASFALLDREIAEKNITHLLGFSQGAFTVVEYFRHGARPASVKGVVALAGYTFREEPDHPYTELAVPLLCMEHAMDATVPASCGYPHVTDRVVHNVKKFAEPTKDAHKIPTQAEFRNCVYQFLMHTNK